MLNNRIAALESTMKSLSTDAAQRTASADDRAARLTVAAEALRAAVERGAPYQAELAAVATLGADQTATVPLEPFAADGLPNAAALAQEFALLTPSLLQARVRRCARVPSSGTWRPTRKNSSASRRSRRRPAMILRR